MSSENFADGEIIFARSEERKRLAARRDESCHQKPKQNPAGRAGLFAEEFLAQAALSDHRLERVGQDIIAITVARDRYIACHATDNPAILAVTAVLVPVQYEAVLKQYLDELTKGAFQAGQGRLYPA